MPSTPQLVATESLKGVAMEIVKIKIQHYPQTSKITAERLKKI
jgi:hypothetical protein